MKYLKHVFLVLLLGFVSQLYGQSVLVKKDGSTIPYKRMSFHSGFIRLTTTDKDKIDLEKSDVEGVIDDFLFKMHYLKPSLDSVGLTSEFNFMEREQDGEIKLYAYRLVNPSVIKLYAEKGGKYEKVFSTDLLDKKKVMFASLREFFEDDPKTLQVLDDPDFKLRDESVHQVINNYNLRKFAGVTAEDLKNTVGVSFYATVRGKDDKTIQLTVNDSLQYNITNLPQTVTLTTKTPSKVCLIGGERGACTLMHVTAFGMKYFELFFNANNNKYEIKQRSTEDAQKTFAARRTK
jgi:hypothetical protein